MSTGHHRNFTFVYVNGDLFLHTHLTCPQAELLSLSNYFRYSFIAEPVPYPMENWQNWSRYLLLLYSRLLTRKSAFLLRQRSTAWKSFGKRYIFFFPIAFGRSLSLFSDCERWLSPKTLQRRFVSVVHVVRIILGKMENVLFTNSRTRTCATNILALYT